MSDADESGPRARSTNRGTAETPNASVAYGQLVYRTLGCDTERMTNVRHTRPPFSLSQGDAVDWLHHLPDASVDLLVTDPPYESLEKHRAIGTTTRLSKSKSSSNAWFTIFPNSRFDALFREAYRVLQKNSHFYLFCDQETAFVAKPLAEAAGFKFWKPLIWDKVKIGMGYHYRSRYEFILFFEKGKRKLSNLGQADIITCPRVYNGYPTEKPIDVAKVLIAQSTLAGELVADPFMGSGSTGVAALSLGRQFAGNDLGEDSIRIARERLLNENASESNVADILTSTSGARSAVSRRRSQTELALGDSAVQTVAAITSTRDGRSVVL